MMKSNICGLFFLVMFCSACTENIGEEVVSTEPISENIVVPDVKVEAEPISKTEEFKKTLENGVSITTDFLKSSSEEISKKLQDGGNAISELNTASKDKVIEVTNDVIGVLPLLEEVGYRTNEFKVEISIPPVIEVRFSKFLNVPAEKVKAIEEKYKDNIMFNMIWSVLETSNAVSSKLDTDNFNFEEIVVNISIPPKVRLRYVNKNLKEH